MSVPKFVGNPTVLEFVNAIDSNLVKGVSRLEKLLERDLKNLRVEFKEDPSISTGGRSTKAGIFLNIKTLYEEFESLEKNIGLDFQDFINYTLIHELGHTIHIKCSKLNSRFVELRNFFDRVIDEYYFSKKIPTIHSGYPVSPSIRQEYAFGCFQEGIAIEFSEILAEGTKYVNVTEYIYPREDVWKNYRAMAYFHTIHPMGHSIMHAYRQKHGDKNFCFLATRTHPTFWKIVSVAESVGLRDKMLRTFLEDYDITCS
jgi:hypothetical protein